MRYSLLTVKDLLENNLLVGYLLDGDLPGCEYNFLLDYSSTVMRSDICVYNVSAKGIFLVELTVPFEENEPAAKEREQH